MMVGMRERVLAWAGAGVAVAAAAGLGAYFAVAGLGRATDVASVIAMFIGLAGLAVSVYGIYRAHHDAARSAEEGGGQTVANSTVTGNVTQISGVTGDIRIGEVQATRTTGPDDDGDISP
jgi:Co/Zn/Cd efflux system component